MKYCFLLGLLITGVAFASSAQAKPDDKLRQVEQQLNEKKQQQEALAAAALDAGKNLEDLRQRMIRSTQTLQEKEAEQETLEGKLDELTQEISAKSKGAELERKQFSLMVSALVEIASRPPESLFLQDRTAIDHIHRSLLLQAILPRLRQQTEVAAQDLAALYELQTQLAAQKRLASAAKENLQKQQRDLDQMIATRQGFLQRTEEQKAETARHLAALADEAHDLRQLMEKIAPPSNRKRSTPAKELIAGLKWPVLGSVDKPFGDKDADGVTSEGVTLSAPSGAPVAAPRAGRVVFTGPFRGYGQIVILQHSNGYYSFLSGFGRIDAEMGQEVAAGEPLGVLPVKAGTKPELYFEWRRGDEPVDPTRGLTRSPS
ncbi:MAG: peptidoglycan DD-metalloendopeptidase family protein [Alphaproteobacteria bacterium]|nr:peptidoglycan DD-metalloendopeptidase family protein [Alphaproteobacteria bacterium]